MSCLCTFEGTSHDCYIVLVKMTCSAAKINSKTTKQYKTYENMTGRAVQMDSKEKTWPKKTLGGPTRGGFLTLLPMLALADLPGPPLRSQCGPMAFAALGLVEKLLER